jgi:hypothetical protein
VGVRITQQPARNIQPQTAGLLSSDEGRRKPADRCEHSWGGHLEASQADSVARHSGLQGATPHARCSITLAPPAAAARRAGAEEPTREADT